MTYLTIPFEGRALHLATHGPADHIHRSIERRGTFYEIDLLTRLRNLHVPGTRIYDVGANVGNHTLYFAAVIGAPVRTFEPYGPSHARLVRTIALNGLGARVRAEPFGLAAAAGLAAADVTDPANLGSTRIAPDPAGALRLDTLDAVAGDDPIGLLKIDVEGGELAVLQGGLATLRARRPIVVAEAADDAHLAPLAALLADLGYAIEGRYAATATYIFKPG